MDKNTKSPERPISKFRGIDQKVYKYLQEVKATTKPELRRKFTAHGEGALAYSLNSLVHKGVITVKGSEVLLNDQTR